MSSQEKNYVFLELTDRLKSVRWKTAELEVKEN